MAWSKTPNPRLNKLQIDCLTRLLDMEYTPTELAAEIHSTYDTVTRSYLPAGCPFRRDSKNRIWIHGVAFRDWAYKINYQGSKNKKRAHGPMSESQGWCLGCKKPVEMIQPKKRKLNNSLDLVYSLCPSCGLKVNKLQSRKGNSRHNTPGMHQESQKRPELALHGENDLQKVQE